MRCRSPATCPEIPHPLLDQRLEQFCPLTSLTPSSAGLTAGDFQKFLSDIVLPQLVVLERQVVDQRLGVVRGVLHRYHARALLTGLGIQQNLVNINVEIMREQITDELVT